MAKRSWKVWTGWIAGTLLLLLLLAALGIWLFLRASLAQLDGERAGAGLQAAVSIERDDMGVPLIRGRNRLDLAYATGFVHAQERYFQMDLLRRTAAGELAELFGPRALPLDRARRLHRFRARAQASLALLAPQERAFVDRYVAGVNAGLNALKARPFEYLLAGAAPQAWRAEDSLLAVWAMYIDLQGNQEGRELARGWLRDHSDASQLAFLLPQASRWDAPLDATLHAGPPDAPLPPSAPAWWGRTPQAPLQLASNAFVDSVGSNNYAIAGSRSTNGAAIVADDMHLGLQLPNIWYRLALLYTDARGMQRRLVGVTLPGAPPLVIAGSNGHVAWGFTNSYGDTLDLVEVGVDAARPHEVRTPAGWERLSDHPETIAVKGAPAERLLVRESSLGPLRTAGGRQYAVHWVAHQPQAVNLNHLKLEEAESLDAALAIANTDGIPAQNFVGGDRAGNIGWTIAGMLPRRAEAGTGNSFPLAGGATAPGWQGLLAPQDYPRVVNPPEGQITTANSRQLAGPGSALLGDGGYDLGMRNAQLADRVHRLGQRTDVASAFQAALDDRARFMALWRERVLAVLDPAATAGKPRRAEFRRLLETSWNGRADVDSVGYRLARNTMWALHDILFAGVNEELAKLDPKASLGSANPRWPAVLVRLLDTQPSGWLPAGRQSWRELQLAAVDRVIADLDKEGLPLAKSTWGQRNTAAITHPIALAAPALAGWLGMPPDQLPGDAHMPRVAGPKFGQSERMTVSPGREEEGLYNMPGGQSGHPLSPWFRRGHAEWVKGTPLPLLPGVARHTLTLTPARR
ncbi:MAG: penicillin acylase family protein [Pseudomonadota bacterium]